MGSGGVRGSQLLPARQSPLPRCLGVGSVLGPPQVHASPTLLHKHRGLSPVLGSVHMGAGSRLPRIPGKRDCRVWMPALGCLSLTPGIRGARFPPKQKQKLLHRCHQRESGIISLAVNSLSLSFFIYLGRGWSTHTVPQPKSFCCACAWRAQVLESGGPGFTCQLCHVCSL